MSLILEALKKLDREKQAPDRGLLVVGPAEWPAPPDSRPLRRVVVAAAVALSAMGAVLWLYGGRPSTVAPREMPPREVAVRDAAPGGVTTRDVMPREAAPRDAAARAVPPRDERATAVIAPPAVPNPAAVPTAVREPGSREPGSEAAPPQRDAALAGATAEAPDPAPAPRIKDPKPAPGVYQLQAISAQEGQPVAILNDRLVREGDSFDGVRVVRIGADEVEIEVAGRRRVLKF